MHIQHFSILSSASDTSDWQIKIHDMYLSAHNNNAEFRSKQHIKEEKQFEKLIHKIEAEHAAFFNSRPSKTEGEAHDSIYQHYTYSFISGIANVKWVTGSGLNHKIKNEILKAFKEAFGM